MIRPRLFWGALFILAGLIFLASTLGFLKMDLAWKIIWPLAIVFVGLWVILGATLGRNRNVEVENFSIPITNIKSARIEMHHGAGKFEIGIAGNPDNLVEGACSGGVEQRLAVKAGFAHLELHPRGQEFWDSAFPWTNQGLSWKLGFSTVIPLELILKTGANEALVDLSSLKVTHLSVETGASSTRINLPEKVDRIDVKISAGAASIKIQVPQSLAARIHVQSGISSKKIDTTRFPQNGSVYESPDFDSAHHKAEIHIETGVSSIEII
jgi:hypothetical protein